MKWYELLMEYGVLLGVNDSLDIRHGIEFDCLLFLMENCVNKVIFVGESLKNR